MAKITRLSSYFLSDNILESIPLFSRRLFSTTVYVLFPGEKTSRGTAEEREEFLARIVYPHSRLFVDNPDTLRYIIVEELQFERSKV